MWWAASTPTPTPITSRRLMIAERGWRPRASRQRPQATEALAWLSSYGTIDAVAVESTGSDAAAFVRYLREHAIDVVEVNQPHAHTRRRVGKSDPIDAEMAARMLLSGKATVIPKHTDGIVESIRMLRVARNSAVKARTATMIQVRDLIITAPQPLRDQLAQRKTLRGKATICSRFRLSDRDLARPSQAAKFALRSLAQRLQALDHEIAEISIASSSSSLPSPRHAPLSCSGSPPAMPVSCSSLPARTSNASRASPRSRRCAAPAQSPPPQARPPVIASPPAGTAKPTARCTSSLSADCATANALRPTPHAAPAKARVSARSCAASSATSPARSTPHSAPTSPTSPPDHNHGRAPRSSAPAPASGSIANALDIYRNVPVRLTSAVCSWRGAALRVSWGSGARTSLGCSRSTISTLCSTCSPIGSSRRCSDRAEECLYLRRSARAG